MLRFLIIIFYLFLFSEVAYAKDSKALFELLLNLAKKGHEIQFDVAAKDFGFKNFSDAVKDYKKTLDVKLSTKEAKSFFNDFLPEEEIKYTKENADKLFEVIINSKNQSAKNHKKYLSFSGVFYKAFAITLNVDREFSRITKDPNIKSITKHHAWEWSYGSSREQAVKRVMTNCQRNFKKYRIPFQECMVIDINGNNVLYEFIPHIREAAIKKKNKEKILLAEKEKEEANKKKAEEANKKKAEELKKKRADEEKKRLEKEKLEAKRKAEEEKLEAKRKAEEEKKKLLEEKIKQQKALDEKKLSLLPVKPIEEKAKKALIDIQKFIKNNPDEFDILEISEFFIKTKPILENSFNEQLEKDLNSLIKFVQTSENFQSYLKEIEIKEREKNLEYINKKISLINEQIAKVTNLLYEMPNSIHAENWLNSVKKAKQKLNNFNSLEEILVSSNELGAIISYEETLVKLNSESENLIIELKGYLAENLTTDLAPKILEQIENIKNSIVSENNNNIKNANKNANNFINKIFLEPKKKTDGNKEKLSDQQKADGTSIANSKKENIEKHKRCMKLIEASFNKDWDNKIFKNKNIKKLIDEDPAMKEMLKQVRLNLIMGATKPKKRKGKYHWDDFAGMGMLFYCPPDQFNLELKDINY